jgi:hypothetical protein
MEPVKLASDHSFLNVEPVTTDTSDLNLNPTHALQDVSMESTSSTDAAKFAIPLVLPVPMPAPASHAQPNPTSKELSVSRTVELVNSPTTRPDHATTAQPLAVPVSEEHSRTASPAHQVSSSSKTPASQAAHPPPTMIRRVTAPHAQPPAPSAQMPLPA